MKIETLILCPLKKEWSHLEESLKNIKIQTQRLQDQGRWFIEVPQWKAALCVGGHGKAQFASLSQYWLQNFKETRRMIVLGAAGGIQADLKPGAVVSVSEILEHDYKEKFQDKAPLPLFKTQNGQWTPPLFDFPLVSGRLASGDEDIVDSERAAELRETSKAIAVAWESAGGIRTAQFHQIPYFEFRGITDNACEKASFDFSQNLPKVMDHLAEVLKVFMEFQK